MWSDRSSSNGCCCRMRYHVFCGLGIIQIFFRRIIFFVTVTPRDLCTNPISPSIMLLLCDTALIGIDDTRTLKMGYIQYISRVQSGTHTHTFTSIQKPAPSKYTISPTLHPQPWSLRCTWYRIFSCLEHCPGGPVIHRIYPPPYHVLHYVVLSSQREECDRPLVFYDDMIFTAVPFVWPDPKYKKNKI